MKRSKPFMNKLALLSKRSSGLLFCLISILATIFATIPLIFKNHIVLVISILVFICLSIVAISFFFNTGTIENKKSYEELAREIEILRIQEAPNSKPHEFSSGVCKKCGNSVSAAHYFGRYECKALDEQDA